MMCGGYSFLWGRRARAACCAPRAARGHQQQRRPPSGGLPGAGTATLCYFEFAVTYMRLKGLQQHAAAAASPGAATVAARRPEPVDARRRLKARHLVTRLPHREAGQPVPLARARRVAVAAEARGVRRLLVRPVRRLLAAVEAGQRDAGKPPGPLVLLARLLARVAPPVVVMCAPRVVAVLWVLGAARGRQAPPASSGAAAAVQRGGNAAS